MITIVDFGSQFTQLIAKQVRALGVDCEILPADGKAFRQKNPGALILSGGPRTVTEAERKKFSFLTDLKTPTLGICYGMQLLARVLGGKVESSKHREYGASELEILKKEGLLSGIQNPKIKVWMSHGDSVTELPAGAIHLAKTKECPVAAFQLRNFTAVQFHPEVFHTEQGEKIFQNFIFKVAGLKKNWNLERVLEQYQEGILKSVPPHAAVVGGVSGGVDSTVLAVLLQKTLGDRFHPVFVDTGLLRKGEREFVEQNLSKVGVQLKTVDASKIFLKKLKGVIDPEKKRKVIGHTFIEIFKKACKGMHNIEFLAQGTLYPDVVESSSHKGRSVTIKTHHNVGGLPKELGFKLLEPFSKLFKDDVRTIGNLLHIPEVLLGRHPFPGPGLAVRILGEVTPKRLGILREADHLFIQKLHEKGLYSKIWQAFAVLLPIQTVGVMGDHRTYDSVLALRAVTSRDGMTADWYPLPSSFLEEISNQIINSIPGINRVVYDVTSKPPATIEWE